MKEDIENKLKSLEFNLSNLDFERTIKSNIFIVANSLELKLKMTPQLNEKQMYQQQQQVDLPFSTNLRQLLRMTNELWMIIRIKKEVVAHHSRNSISNNNNKKRQMEFKF